MRTPRTETEIRPLSSRPARGRLPYASRSGASRTGCWAHGRFHFALATVTVLVFSPALRNGFVQWDDYTNLIANPHYRGLGWTQIRWMFGSILMGHYIPITWLTFGLDYTLWGMNPFGYHLTNMLIHGANAALFYLISVRLLAKVMSLPGPALIAGGGMGHSLCPAPAAGVVGAWATERRDVLCVPVLPSHCPWVSQGARRARAHRAAASRASLALYALALLSSPSPCVAARPAPPRYLPARAPPMRWASWKDTADGRVDGEAPVPRPRLAGAVTSLWAAPPMTSLTSVALWVALSAAIAAYVSGFLRPRSCCRGARTFPMYELPVSGIRSSPGSWRGGAVVVAISAAVLALRRRWPAGLAVWAYYGIVLGPVSGIVHAGYQLAHDRYSYLSCLGWALLVGAAAGTAVRAVTTGALLSPLSHAAAAVAAIWIVALGGPTVYQLETGLHGDVVAVRC